MTPIDDRNTRLEIVKALTLVVAALYATISALPDENKRAPIDELAKLQSQIVAMLKRLEEDING